MTTAGRFLTSKDGTSDRSMSALDSRDADARPLSLSSADPSFSLTAGCSSVYMTGIRGATPPPTG